jgi:type II secretory pathway pseudopilin PulG
MTSLRLRGRVILALLVMASLAGSVSLQGQDLDTDDVRVTLDSALQLAQDAAAAAFPDLSDYLLYSVTPRVLKGDPHGLHWQVRWQERDFPHRGWLVVRIYMSSGRTTTERGRVSLMR